MTDYLDTAKKALESQSERPHTCEDLSGGAVAGPQHVHPGGVVHQVLHVFSDMGVEVVSVTPVEEPTFLERTLWGDPRHLPGQLARVWDGVFKRWIRAGYDRDVAIREAWDTLDQARRPPRPRRIRRRSPAQESETDNDTPSWALPVPDDRHRWPQAPADLMTGRLYYLRNEHCFKCRQGRDGLELHGTVAGDKRGDPNPGVVLATGADGDLTVIECPEDRRDRFVGTVRDLALALHVGEQWSLEHETNASSS